MGAQASGGLNRPAPTASIPRIPRRVGVIIDISAEGRKAARKRAAAPKLGRVNRPGGTGSVEHVRPPRVNLPSSDPNVVRRTYLGNEMMNEGNRRIRKPTIHTSLGQGKSPLPRWTDRAPSQVFSEVPGASVQKAAAKGRSSNNLTSRLQRGILPLGQWNTGSYASIRAARPGKAIADQGQRGRSSANLSARIAKGEKSLEVKFSRHIVRPDGGRTAG
jgi:hypothetical protein